MIKFSCEKVLLQSAIAVTSRAVAQKSSIPALEGLLIHVDQQLTVSGYNMQPGIRTEVDYEDEMMGTKVKKYRQDKVPYTVIVGDKEMAEGTVSLKIRGGAGANDIPLDTFVETCREMVKTNALTLKTEI